MSGESRLIDFVGAALKAGRGRNEIAEALVDAGWSRSEATDALGAFADTGFTPPVPAPVPIVSARDFFTYALIFIALGLTAWHTVWAAHAIIDMAFGERPEWASEDWRQSSLNLSIAVLVVFAPLYFVRSRQAAIALRADPSRNRSAIRGWSAALILLITVLVLLGVLANVIYRFLQDGGDLVFLLKSLVTGVVAGAIFLAYRRSDG